MSTIKDIAAALGISHSTVSRALNDSSLVNMKTKEKVREMADKLNYIPNENARSLKLSKSHNIGVFFSSIRSGTSPSLIYEVTQKISETLSSNYNVILKGIDTYMKQYNSINSQNFEGVIVVSQKEDDDEFIQKVIDSNIPVIVINRKINNLKVISLFADDSNGAELAIEHLYSYGHRNINIIKGRHDFYSNICRLKGVMKSVYAHNMNIITEEWGDYGYESGYKAMKNIIDNNMLGTALFAFNDDMAIGAMKACYENGLNLPRDYSIIGFDSDQITNYTYPALTTINRPVRAICAEAAKLLLDKIGKNVKENYQITYKNELIIRESVQDLT